MEFQEFRKYNPVKHGSSKVDITLNLRSMRELKKKHYQKVLDIDNGLDVQAKDRNFMSVNCSDEVTLIVKACHSCNLRCWYCYDKLSRSSEKIDMPAVRRILEVFKDCKSIHWTWHGGEPLLLGVDFYKEANALIREMKPGTEISIQSNGTLLNDEFYELFEDTGVGYPGLSFDGILNETTRKSTKEILKAFKHYRDKRGSVGAILVITNDNIANIIDEYEYAKLLQYSPQMNLIFDPGYDVDGRLLTPELVVKHITDFFEYWIHDVNGTGSHLLSEYVERVLGSQNTHCNYKLCNGRWMGIDPNGDILPCGRNWIDFEPYGNIWDIENYKEIFERDRYKEWDKQVTDSMNCERCSNCDWHTVCNGDCPGASYIADKDFKTPNITSCEITRGILTYIYNRLLNFDLYSNPKNYNHHFLSILIKQEFISKKLIDEVHGGVNNG